MDTSKIIFIVFSVSMFLISFIIPGLLLRSAATSQPNAIIGFRTGRAFLSKETWNYANNKAGELFLKSGILYLVIVSILLISSFIINLKVVIGEIYIIIPVIIPLVFITYIIVKVQNELKRKFDDKGVKI